MLREQAVQQVERVRVLEAGESDRPGREARCRHLLGQHVDRRDIPGLQMRPVEQQGRHRAGAGGRRIGLRAGDRCGLLPEGGAAEQVGRIAQAVERVFGAALRQVAPEAAAGGRIEAGPGIEVRVRPVVARQQGDRRVNPAQPLDAVGPVAAPAEQPHHDQPGAGEHALDMQIHGQVVAERHDIGEPERRCLPVLGEPSFLGLGEQREFRVGGAQDRNVARRLPEIDGLAVLDRAGRCR